ncbi:MAG: hypothetical protein ACLP00_11055, partial [Terracidiphilus sp.]
MYSEASMIWRKKRQAALFGAAWPLSAASLQQHELSSRLAAMVDFADVSAGLEVGLIVDVAGDGV